MVALTRQKGIILQLKESIGSRQSNIMAQRAYRGHTIYFPQDTQFVATVLPPPVEDIVNHICVLFVGSEPPTTDYLRQNARPLAVRPDRVRHALLWLKENNHLYRDITLNEEVLESIEQNGGIKFSVTQVDKSVVHDDATTGYFDQYSIPNLNGDVTRDNNNDSNNTIPFQTLVITDLDASPTAAQMRSAAIRHLQQGKPFLQIGHGRTPKPDHHNHNLFPSMYPTLYPYGVGGFEDPSRLIRVGFAAHLQH
ncbi:hypothetical protein F5887DRAFT_822739, partial [Amanita rubescens]